MSGTEQTNVSLVRRVIAASTIGTIMEWYDFYLYGFGAALIFNKLFFPQLDPLAGTLAAFGSYALGFFARPVGGLVFGNLGDRIGRRSMLVITMIVMGAATALMGLLPTYDTLGVWAAVLLTVLRIVQGFAAGAEWGGAVVLAGEYAPPKKRGYYTSIPNAGVFVAIILAIGILQLFSTNLSTAAFLSWGWRVPFLLSVILIGVGLYLRLKISESPDFQELQRSKRLVRRPIVEVFKRSWRSILLGMGTRFAETGGGYIIITFVLTYLAQKAGLARGIGQYGLMIGSVFAIITIPLFGRLSDRIGRKRVFAIGAVALVVFIFPYFWLLDKAAVLPIVVAMVISLALCYGAMAGAQPAMFSELFDTDVRVTGVVLVREISAPIAGGVAPFIATALLLGSGGASWPIGIYVVAMCVFSLICLIFLPAGSMKTGGPIPRVQRMWKSRAANMAD